MITLTLSEAQTLNTPVELVIRVRTKEGAAPFVFILTRKGKKRRTVDNTRKRTFERANMNETTGIDVSLSEVEKLLRPCPCYKESFSKDFREARKAIDYAKTERKQGIYSGAGTSGSSRVWQTPATDCYRTFLRIQTHRASSPQRSFEYGRPGGP